MIPLSDDSVTSAGGNTHTFIQNGSFTFEFTDAAGNTGTAVATVNWIDKIPPIATISGLPDTPTNIQEANLTVSGTDVIAYRYKIDDGDYNDENDIILPIILNNLAEGVHTVSVVGKDTAGNWQSETEATTASWEIRIVDPGDVNDDGIADLTDAILALQIVSGISPDQDIYKSADVNGDNSIGIEEMIFILQKVSELR